MQSSIPLRAWIQKKFTCKFSLGNQKIMIDNLFSSPFSTSSFFLVIYIYIMLCVGHLPTTKRQGYIVFGSIIEYSSLREFGPSVVILGLFLFMRIFGRSYFDLCRDLRLVYRVIIISWRNFWFLLENCLYLFEGYNFCMVKYLSFS